MGQWLSHYETHEPEEDYPWIWAIRDVQQLDFKQGLSYEQAVSVVQKQTQMPVEILPHLYLSNARSAHDVKLMKLLHVTHILNAAGAAARAMNRRLYKPAGIAMLEFDGRDEEGFPMLRRYLFRARRFIEDAKAANGRVVVHCVAGLNRSGVLVAAEYMLSTRSNVLDTVAHCRRQRGNLCICNKSFQAQLVALARIEGLLGPPPGHPQSRVQSAPPSRSATIPHVAPTITKVAPPLGCVVSKERVCADAFEERDDDQLNSPALPGAERSSSA